MHSNAWILMVIAPVVRVRFLPLESEGESGERANRLQVIEIVMSLISIYWLTLPTFPTFRQLIASNWLLAPPLPRPFPARFPTRPPIFLV